MGKQPKAPKPRYVDDGRTLADMSGVSGPRFHRSKNASRSTGKEKWDTYWAAVRMMFVPMLCFITGLIIIYMIVYAVFMFL